ncbi:diphthine--ammonia ligase [Candidatus Pacearchaeota archaeon]|nr:diphthine--ammonia ligase [Candidatus Pacearchaeota archaeon]
MKLGILFSGGKDSMYALYLAKKEKYSVECLISIYSDNKESFMFHTPSIKNVEQLSLALDLPLVSVTTLGEKEKELEDLEKAIRIAIQKYKIEGIVTGAVESVYQASRIQKICCTLQIECFNPLWQKSGEQILWDLVKNKFKVMITGVFAFPLDKSWLGRVIDASFISDMKKLHERYGISMNGEGGEYESLVISCPLFKRKVRVKNYEDFGEKNSWRREVSLE